ncbi:MAG TPA: hypothetical protein VKW06_06825 [Candidatus Angelobacter sp.]|nr:hypothetical protein [Candidatus Angelobacter sp.]
MRYATRGPGAKASNDRNLQQTLSRELGWMVSVPGWQERVEMD